MDGEKEPITHPPLSEASPPSGPPRVRTFKCSACGHPLTIRGMEQTEAMACEACGSIIDLSDPNFKIISTYQAKVKHKPLIPLGSRGTLQGETFEMIGYLRRAITVEGVDYEWSEYLLFNPYKGFRWLTEYHGHWNLIRVTHNIPKPKEGGSQLAVLFLDQTFLGFQKARARVVFVLGEFYWKVRVGEECEITDFISPPRILSKEETGKDVVWALGEYIEPDILWKTFHPPSSPPLKIGIAPNQPSPYAGKSSAIMKMFGYFLLAALGIHLLSSILAGNKLVFEKDFVFRQMDQEKAFVTDFFEMPGHTSNVLVKTTANVSNHWMYLHMGLIHEEGQAYTFGREISYYHGVEDGERWSEGSSSDEAFLPAVPPGKYYLLLEPESSAPRVNYKVQVYRDVPQWSFFWLTTAALCVIPLLMKWRSSRFEAARWAESDFSCTPSQPSPSEGEGKGGG